MAKVIGTQFNNYSWSDIHDMMMEYVDGEWELSNQFARSHPQYGAVENDREFEPGVYMVPTTGSYFVEVRKDNPRVVWYIDTHKFLMEKGRIT